MTDVDPTWLAISRFRRRRHKQTIEMCTNLLAENPLYQMVWYIKTRALTAEQYLDETELEEEGGENKNFVDFTSKFFTFTHSPRTFF